jgi:glycosyltransferase involved in cell wall biosynthesis
MTDNCIDVCICTHNPRPDIFEATLRSLAWQTADKRKFRVLIVDNASAPRINESVLSPLKEAGIDARLVVEEKPGLARARLKAIAETKSDWVLFLDDDNELLQDFLENGCRVIDGTSEIGCFGGKLLLPDYIKPPPLLRRYLPYLAIKDHGDEVITDRTDYWGPWEPPGAGSFVHRKVLEIYKNKSEHDELFFRLGRTGSKSVASCEDSLMMRGAVQLGLYCSYQPSLRIIHHISPDRVKIRYLLKLMYGFGVSTATCELMLNKCIETPSDYQSYKSFYKLLKRTLTSESGDPFIYTLGVMIMYCGQFKTYRNRGFK